MDHHPTTTVLPTMNALEILRETIRLLRSSPNPFLLSLLLLISPYSASLLSIEPLLLRRHVILLSQSLLSLLLPLPLPSPPPLLLLQLSHHLSGTLLSSLLTLPLLLLLLLPSRSLVSLSVAFLYAHRKPLSPLPFPLLRSSFPRLLITFIYIYLTLLLLLSLFLLSLSLTFRFFPPYVTLLPALLVLLVFSVVYAHAIIVCNLAAVMSVLEDVSGVEALLRSVRPVEGQTQAGLLIFLGSTIGMAFVEGLFEHRVKTLSYGDGSSRIWEGPLLVFMYSFVVLIDFMMSAVFYFTCRSSEAVEAGALVGDDEEEMERIIGS